MRWRHGIIGSLIVARPALADGSQAVQDGMVSSPWITVALVVVGVVVAIMVAVFVSNLVRVARRKCD